MGKAVSLASCCSKRTGGVGQRNKPTLFWTDFHIMDLCGLIKSVGMIGKQLETPIFLVTGFLTATVPFQLSTKD